MTTCLPQVGFDAPPYPIKANEKSPHYWEHLARNHIDRANKQFPEFSKTAKKAKNAILFLGDGMGLPTISATRFYKHHDSGKAVEHSFEEWDFGTLCRTYDLETMVTDSASSATAYLTGTKTRTSMIGLTGQVEVHECREYTEAEKLESVLMAAQKAGKWTGIVTSARVTHASPAGCFGHVAFRDWESDKDITCKNCECTDLAYQLVKMHPDVRVTLGGGQAYFYPNTETLPSDVKSKGNRLDGRNLTDEWQDHQKSKNRTFAYLDSWESFKKQNFEDVDYVLGLLTPSHLDYVLDQAPGEPNLLNLTLAALKILQRSPNGYFLFVEGARIDQAHHENRAHKSFEEMRVFDETIRQVSKIVDHSDTMLILTADHSHSFELVGRPSRFKNLLLQDTIKGSGTLDGKGMLPVGYMTGPAAKMNATRDNISAMTSAQLEDKDFQQQALIPIGWATHGGDDVPVYADGPFSYLFHTTVDNTFVAQAMKYALCLRPYDQEPFCLSGSFVQASIFAIFWMLSWLLLY